MSTSPTNDQVRFLRDRSGNIATSDPLTSFIYELMRDHVQPGVVEKLVCSIQVHRPTSESPDYFTNGWLAQYAHDLAQRLMNNQPAPGESPPRRLLDQPEDPRCSCHAKGSGALQSQRDCDVHGTGRR